MKQTLLLYTFLLLGILFLSSHKVTTSGRHIQWGNEGQLKYVVYENKLMYHLRNGNIVHETGVELDKTTIKDLFQELDFLKYEKIEVNNATGNHFIIKIITTKNQHTISWENEIYLGKKNKEKVLGFYSSLMKLTK